MTTQHTQGRLIARMPSDELHAIRDIRGRIVADVGYSETTERDMANARRLVAAWNACEGISTEALETEGSAAMGWTRTASKLIHATKQRDDLLEALTRCITAIERTDHYTDADRSAAADHARAAIAKVEGGAA